MKIKQVAVIGLASIFFLSGCNGSSIDSIQEDYNSLGQNQTSEVLPTEEASAYNVPNQLDYTVMSKSGDSRLKVSAEIITDGMDAASVFSVEPAKIDDAFLISLADKLFDDGVYTIKKPYICCTDVELQAEKTHLDQIFAMTEDQKNYETSEAMLEVLDILDGYDASRVQKTVDGKVIYHIENSKYFTKVGGEVEEMIFDIGVIEGLVKGRQFQLYYSNYNGYENIKLRLIEPALSTDGLCSLDSTLYEEVFGDNVMDIDAARTISANIMSRLGYSEYTEFTAGKRKCLDDRDNPILDGYYFYYSRTVNGIQNMVCGNTRGIPMKDMINGLENYAEEEYVCVKVDHRGLLGINFGGNYTIGDPLSTDVELMDFDQIDEIAQGEIEYILGIFEKSSSYDEWQTITENWSYPSDVDQVRFSYIPVHYDNQYVYVPVWIYSTNYYNYGDQTIFSNRDALFAINALDGTVIHLNYARPLKLSNRWYEGC